MIFALLRPWALVCQPSRTSMTPNTQALLLQCRTYAMPLLSSLSLFLSLFSFLRQPQEASENRYQYRQFRSTSNNPRSRFNRIAFIPIRLVAWSYVASRLMTEFPGLVVVSMRWASSRWTSTSQDERNGEKGKKRELVLEEDKEGWLLLLRTSTNMWTASIGNPQDAKK